MTNEDTATEEMLSQLAAKFRSEGKIAEALLMESGIHKCAWTLRDRLAQANVEDNINATGGTFISLLIDVMISLVGAELAGTPGTFAQKIQRAKVTIEYMEATGASILAQAVIMSPRDHVEAMKARFTK